jgi:hypothetical protein
LADGLSQVTFAGARRTEKQGVFVTSDEGASASGEPSAERETFYANSMIAVAT